MEGSTMHWMAKRGKIIRQIAVEVGHSPITKSRSLIVAPKYPRFMGLVNLGYQHDATRFWDALLWDALDSSR